MTKLKLTLAFAILTIAAPAFAQTSTHTTGAHMRSQSYHDRSPRIHDRSAQPHHQA